MVSASLLAASSSPSAEPAAPKPLVEAGEFHEVYDPSAGDKEHWALNDHTFVYGPDHQWHVFAITHPVPLNWYRDPGKNLLHATARTLTQSPWWRVTFSPVQYGFM